MFGGTIFCRATILHLPTITLFSVPFNKIEAQDAVDAILLWVGEDKRLCRYVVTPNVDHIVKLSENSTFRDAYAQASLILVDGKPVLWASRILREPLPCLIPGSDLVPAIFNTVIRRNLERRLSVFLLGAMPGVAQKATEEIHRKWGDGIQVAGFHSPPLGFEGNDAECEKILDMIAVKRPDLLIIGLGAPKQEIWVQKYAARLPVNAAICAGAVIDFLAGHKKRAPSWMRRAGLEWLHRLSTEPKRLAGRYAYDAFKFPQLVMKEWLFKTK